MASACVPGLPRGLTGGWGLDGTVVGLDPPPGRTQGWVLRSCWSRAGEGLPAGSAQGQILAELAHLPSVLLSQRGMPLSLRAEGCVSHSPLCLCGCPLDVPGLAVPVHSGLWGPGS